MGQEDAVDHVIEVLRPLDAKFESSESNFRLAMLNNMFTTVSFVHGQVRRAVTVVFRGGAEISVSVQYAEDTPMGISSLASRVDAIAHAAQRCRDILEAGG